MIKIERSQLPKVIYTCDDWGNQNCVHVEIEVLGHNLFMGVSADGLITITSETELVRETGKGAINQVKLQMDCKCKNDLS